MRMHYCHAFHVELEYSCYGCNSGHIKSNANHLCVSRGQLGQRCVLVPTSNSAFV